MQQVYIFIWVSLLITFLNGEKSYYSNISGVKGDTTEWLLSDLTLQNKKDVKIIGRPEIIYCKYGKALEFNGVNDGLFLDSMPLNQLEEYTVEAIVCPYSGGSFEQRFFHCGEVKGARLLLELRSVQNGWYFDAFIKSGDKNKALIDPNLLHTFNQWYHLAFVISHGKIETYINSQKELESRIHLLPIHGGKTSIGVRLNQVSWFKGAIYKIRISPKALKPDQFLAY